MASLECCRAAWRPLAVGETDLPAPEYSSDAATAVCLGGGGGGSPRTCKRGKRGGESEEPNQKKKSTAMEVDATADPFLKSDPLSREGEEDEDSTKHDLQRQRLHRREGPVKDEGSLLYDRKLKASNHYRGRYASTLSPSASASRTNDLEKDGKDTRLRQGPGQRNLERRRPERSSAPSPRLVGRVGQTTALQTLLGPSRRVCYGMKISAGPS